MENILEGMSSGAAECDLPFSSLSPCSHSLKAMQSIFRLLGLACRQGASRVQANLWFWKKVFSFLGVVSFIVINPCISSLGCLDWHAGKVHHMFNQICRSERKFSVSLELYPLMSPGLRKDFNRGNFSLMPLALHLELGIYRILPRPFMASEYVWSTILHVNPSIASHIVSLCT